MKKIVALVLSLVMVLGLATTAFAADSTVSGLYAKGTGKTDKVVENVSVDFYKAVDNKVNKDGSWKDNGNVAYYDVNGWGIDYVQVSTLGEADVVLYTDKDCENVYMYLDQADATYYGDGVVTTNFGEKCGQYTDDETVYDDELTYYVAFNTLYVGVEPGAAYQKQLMVNGKLVAVNEVNTIAKNTHKPVFTFDKNNKLEAVKCSVCGVVAVEAPNFASIPEKADQTGLQGNWYWTTGTVSADGDKIESAETFDAGIAMYVGMSVMAAAGSAVVLKKKD